MDLALEMCSLIFVEDWQTILRWLYNQLTKVCLYFQIHIIVTFQMT